MDFLFPSRSRIWEWAFSIPFPFPNPQKSFPLTPDVHLQRGCNGLAVTYLNAIDLWCLALGRTMGEKGWLTDQALDIWYDCCDGKGMPKIGSWGKNDPKMERHPTDPQAHKMPCLKLLYPNGL